VISIARPLGGVTQAPGSDPSSLYRQFSRLNWNGLVLNTPLAEA
jgi:hypothetical protein